MPRTKKLIVLRHLYGYNDITETKFEQQFDYYQVIGCRTRPSCITPCSRRNNDLPYYRDYSEAIQTRLYFKNFSAAELGHYVRSFSRDDECVGCQHPSPRRLVRCRRF